MLLNRAIVQLVEKIRFPIPLKARRINRIEHALQRRMRYWSDKIQSRFKETPDWLEYVLGLVQCSGIAPDDSAHFCVMEVLRKWRSRRHRKKSKETVDVVWRFHDELAIPAHHLRRLLELIQHRPCIVRVYPMSLEQKRRNNSEVTATATDCPE